MPKPTRIKRLEGNPGKRHLNDKEPEPTGLAEPPPFVTGPARSEWERAVAAMPPGFFTNADIPVLTVYALAWVTYRNALARVARDGLIAKGSMGQEIAHPAIGIVSKQAEIILRASDRLGMSPAARSRLEVGDQESLLSEFELLSRPPVLEVANSR